MARSYLLKIWLTTFQSLSCLQEGPLRVSESRCRCSGMSGAGTSHPGKGGVRVGEERTYAAL